MQGELIVYVLVGLLALCAIVVVIVGLLRNRGKPNSGSNGTWFFGDDGSNGGNSGGE